MARQVIEGIHWIQECGLKQDLTEEFTHDSPDWYKSGELVHTPIQAYLITGSDNLLFDTLSPAGGDHLSDEVTAILDGGDLDYIVVSHTEPPHAGNAMRMQREHPDAQLIAPQSINMHELYYLDESTLVTEGDSIDLGNGFVIDFLEAIFPDGPTIWGFERKTKTLFTVDWFGNLHYESECLKFEEEVSKPLSHHRLFHFHSRALFWLEYADAEKTDAEIEHLISDINPNIIAPAHGFPIREDASNKMRELKPILRRISEEGRRGVLA